MNKTPTVRMACGDLSGTATPAHAVFAFKGIPFAEPPVGALRWHAPVPPAPWSGVRPAKAYGPRCIQPELPADSISFLGTEPESEDCLYLNVWTRSLERDAKLPVMVWIHGGGFTAGSGGLSIYDGTDFARRGVVLVTLNYRLGPLGFLVHPELTRQASHDAVGNWGLLDQIAALTWVRDNIESFGGNPDCVTIFGQSVGSSSVNCLMASPLASGLFHRAIGQSGGSVGPPGRPGGGSLMPLDVAEKVTLQVGETLGWRTLEDLRRASATDIQLRWPRDRANRCWVTIDGRVIPADVHAIFSAGHQNDVPLLTGANGDEGTIRAPAPDAATWKAALVRTYGQDGETLYNAYGADTDVDTMSRRLEGQITFNWQNWTWARLQAETGRQKVFAYHFSHAPPIPEHDVYCENRSTRFGAFHTAEIQYVFGTLGARPWPWQQADDALAETLGAYWVNFATSGDPNGAGLPPWPEFQTGTPTVQLIGADIAPGDLPERARFDLLDQCMTRKRAGISQ